MRFHRTGSARSGRHVAPCRGASSELRLAPDTALCTQEVNIRRPTPSGVRTAFIVKTMDDQLIVGSPLFLDDIKAETEALGFTMASDYQTGSLLRTLAASNRPDTFWKSKRAQDWQQPGSWRAWIHDPI